METDTLGNYFLKTVCMKSLCVPSKVYVSQSEDHKLEIKLLLVFVDPCSLIHYKSLYLDNTEKGFSQLIYQSLRPCSGFVSSLVQSLSRVQLFVTP